MAPRRDPAERKYYPFVRKYLAGLGYVTSSFKHTGEEVPFISRGQGQLIVDVYGLKGTSDNRTQALEGVAVEVKRARARTSLRHINQAAQYSRLAHRCYLAQPHEFTEDTKREAARIGVGLLWIKDQRIELVAESRLFEPDPAAFTQFLNSSLRISQCAVCGCFQFRHAQDKGKHESGGGHWRRDDLVARTGRHNKLMYLCSECEEHWAPASQFRQLQKRLERIETRLKRLTKSHRRLKSGI